MHASNANETSITDDAGNSATVYTIDLARIVPGATPATKPVAHGGKVFTAQQLNIVGKALDAGIFYTHEFRDACRADWDAAFPVVDVCLTRDSGRNWIDRAERGEPYTAQMKELKDVLSASPRGAWALLRQAWERDGVLHVSWGAMVSDGFGGVYEPHISHLRAEPTHAQVCACMIDMDIYSARRAEEYRREACRSAGLIRERGWRAGVVLKDVTVGHKPYSSATITDCCGDGPDGANLVTLVLTKRGSKSRWQWTGPAQSVHVANMPVAHPAAGEIVVTQQADDDLFSNAA